MNNNNSLSSLSGIAGISGQQLGTQSYGQTQTGAYTNNTLGNNLLWGGSGQAGISGSSYIYPYYGYQLAVTDPNQIIVRKVENGYILTQHNKEYILTDTKAVETFLKLAGITA